MSRRSMPLCFSTGYRLAFPLRAALGRWALARRPWFSAGRNRFLQPVHHWHPLYSIWHAKALMPYFQRLGRIWLNRFTGFLERPTTTTSKKHRLLLARGAVVGAAASNDDPPDGRLAGAAGLAGTLVDAVFQLEEAANAFRVHVIGDRRAAQPDGVLENSHQRLAETFQFGTGEAPGRTFRPDT